MESRRWVCLEHKAGRKEDMKAEASGEGHRGAGGWGLGVEVENRKFRRAEKQLERLRGEAGKGRRWSPTWPLNRFIICRLLMAGKRPQLEILPVPAKCLPENPICVGLWEQKHHVNN